MNYEKLLFFEICSRKGLSKKILVKIFWKNAGKIFSEVGYSFFEVTKFLAGLSY